VCSAKLHKGSGQNQAVRMSCLSQQHSRNISCSWAATLHDDDGSPPSSLAGKFFNWP